MKNLQFNYKKIGFAVVLVCCISWISPVAAFSKPAETGNMVKSDYEPLPPARKAEHFKQRMDTLDRQIAYFKDELEWLKLKMRHIRDSNRHVPFSMKQSEKSKKEKITTLSRMKQTLQKELDKLKVSDPEPKPESTTPQKTEPEKSITTKESRKEKTRTEDSRDTEKEEASSSDDCRIDRNKLARHIREHDLDDWIEVRESGNCLKLDTTLPILFTTGSAQIASEYKSFFKKFADFLDNYDVKVLVNGYTDPDPINTEKYPTNFELGAARAANVVHELVKNGLKPSIFHIGSTAEHRFQAAGRSDMKSMERKAEVTVIFTS